MKRDKIIILLLAMGSISNINAAENEALTDNDIQENAKNINSKENRAKESSETLDLGTTIVTANKMNQNIQEIPASISVISEADIEDKNIKNITDIVKQIPNLSEFNYGYQRAINFRGINQSLFTSTNPVVIYTDGVPHSSIFGYDEMLENVERVEVLRGPQSTLYGKDSIGGVINIITKSPNNEWTGNVGVEYGSNNHKQGSFTANGALVDNKLFLNVGLLADKNDGWIVNDYDGSDANALEEKKLNTALTLKPNKKLTAKLSLNAAQTNTNFLNGMQGKLEHSTRKKAEHANYDVPSSAENKSFSQALNVDYKFDHFKLLSLTTHKNIKASGRFDGDFSYDPTNAKMTNGISLFQDVDLDAFSQEFKLSSDDNEDFKWVTGIYFDKENNQYKQIGYQFPYIDPKSRKFLGIFETNVPSQTDVSTKAVFAQGSHKIIDDLTLTLGGRYQTIDNETKLTFYRYPASAGKAGAMTNFERNEHTSWNAFLPKVALNYDIDDQVSTFFSYSKGYLPGGFNYFPASPKDNLKYDPQRSDNYEIGMRGKFLNNQLNIGTTLFYLGIDDIHLYDAGYDDNKVYYSVVSNAGKATSKGIELDSTYYLNDNWTLNGAFGLTHAKYTKHTNSKLNGNRVRATPEYSANFGIGYDHPVGLYSRLDVNSQGKIYFDDENNNKQSAWATADLKLGYRKNDFNLYGYVRNITDEEHVENYVTGNSTVHFNAPRFFGMGIKYAF